VFDFSGSGAWPLDKPSSAAYTVSNIGLQIGDFFSASLETPLKQLLQFLLKDFILWLTCAFQQPSNGWYTVCLPGFAVLIFVCFVVFCMGFGKLNFEPSVISMVQSIVYYTKFMELYNIMYFIINNNLFLNYLLSSDRVLIESSFIKLYFFNYYWQVVNQSWCSCGVTDIVSWLFTAFNTC